MLGWFQRLMPHQPLFFALFERHAATVTGAAEALRRMLDGGDQIGQHCRSVMRLEEEADGITRDVLIAVRSTFITPFDRGDIKDLITALDDAIDQMQKTAKAIMLFEMTGFEPEMRAMADNIVDCAQLVARAMPLLANIGQHVGTAQRDLPADQPHRRARRRDPRARPQGALPALQGRRPHGVRARQRDLRSSGKE